MNEITRTLISYSESDYKSFSQKLIPDTKHEILGVRMPKIKKIAKLIVHNSIEDANFFINAQHTYHEEYMLHALIISKISSDINEILKFVDDFLPYVDNWAICDSFVSSLKIFSKHKTIIFDKIIGWIKSDNPYTVRFAVVTLLTYFLGENFTDRVLLLASKACCNHYYVNMAIAWLFSVALVKNYGKTIVYLQNKNLPVFVHNKAIQKAIESYRISDEIKNILRELKIKTPN